MCRLSREPFPHQAKHHMKNSVMIGNLKRISRWQKQAIIPLKKTTFSFLLLIGISFIKNFVKPLVINPKSSCSPICLSLTYFSWDDQKSPSNTFPSPKYPIQCRGVHAQHIQYQNPTGNDFDHILRSKKYLYALVSFFAIHFAVSPLIWFYTLQG